MVSLCYELSDEQLYGAILNVISVLLQKLLKCISSYHM